MKRYNHNRSNTRISSYNMGRLVPSMARHCIQGTTLRGGISAGIQLAPMVHQALTQMRVDTFAIAGYDRILWKDAEDFYTGGSDGNQRPEPPYILAPADGGWKPGDLADHFGFPTGVPNLKCNALPFRLYAYWWNEKIRNPQLQDPVPISFESGLDTVTNTELLAMNWPKDMFTTATPEQQLGDEVVIPLATSAPIRQIGQTATSLIIESEAASGGVGKLTTNAGAVQVSNVTAGSEPNLVTDLSGATGILPSDFNFAMAQQTWKSRRNLFGSTFRDWLAFAGVKYSDRRLQLPETLKHGYSSVDISAVVQSAPGTDSVVGELAGRGSSFAACSYKTYFEEPSTVVHLVCVRPAPVYVNMMPPEWDWEVREDLYTPEYAHVGMVEQKVGTLFPTGDPDKDNVRFGFRNRYDEMRVGFNDVAGSFKTTNVSYHQGRIFESAPALNSDFLECNPSPRIFANMKGDHIESSAIRNTFIERNIVTPNGNPKF